MRRPGRLVAAVVGAVVGLGSLTMASVPAAAAPVGQGFNLNAADLRFILKQIRISERHAAEATPQNPCGTLVGTSTTDQLPTTSLPWGLRTVDGTCNNLVSGRSAFGTADQKFPRLVPKSLQNAEGGDLDGGGPIPPIASSSYTQTSGNVLDSQPRIISNLVVDQSTRNPAALEAGGSAVCTAANVPAGCTPAGSDVTIENVAPDVGLSAPYNSWFTLFGQFFDHGLDLVTKGGNGTVFVPLQADDPLTAGSAPNFMVLSRARHGGDHEAFNQTSPFVDQSQTYSSHPSHQVFLREYALDTAGDPQATGHLLLGPGVGMANWAGLKAQARNVLGIQLTDADVHNVPLLATDQYGRFLRGPNGFPQVVKKGPDGQPATADDVLVEGNLTTPVTTVDAVVTGHAFLDDIAHHAVPGPVDHDNNPGTPTVPATPDADPGTVNDNNGSTYDDEMLNAHFIAGDGRVNENIGLTAVHHIFHSEHNRLADEIRNMVLTDPQVTAAERTEWQTSTRFTNWNFGERLFQAARFVTEMEYQHLAFEEFIRKVQPMVAPFGEGGTGYNANINPAIKAEFAHAVYRFGHSMLNDTVARVTETGARADIALFDAFLDPTEFQRGTANANEAAGNIIRGMTRQVGNELDEFVSGSLRNQLLGLPLDLATLNIARARETGIPTLNAARRSFFAASGNSALAPYVSWADLGFGLKHPKSLVNFVAAYGTHDSVTGATTVVAKRDAAEALVYGTAGPNGEPEDDPATPAIEGDDIAASRVPADRYAFLNSVAHEPVAADGSALPGGHSRFVSGANGVTTTGVDRIDLWVGGLAEKQMVFGGLLGPTFNYVFEQQMEDLQFGDRFYYLARTAGLNMLTQLEGNSFSELIHRNTNVEGLPADSFSRPSMIFNLANLGTSGPVPDDPSTVDYNEAALLTRMPDGTVRYGGPEHVVFNGTAGANRVWSSEGDDTIRGNDGNDWMQGGDGNDNHVGGLGDDILLDTNGDDTLKGGDGNDTLSSGQGFAGDLNQGGRGNDFIVHGDLAEAFAGPGDDYVLGGPEDDTVFGDDGDDWIDNGATAAGTGGGAFNLLQGDNGAPFQDDPNDPGHDVLVGYGGETDYDAEGGDDIMLMGAEIQRSEGMLGFDWGIHKLDPQPGDSDMRISGLLPPGPAIVNRDRFDLVEALSGWNQDDKLRGDDRVAVDMVDHELTAAGLGRVTGLGALLPSAAPFSAGNILIGGAGSDEIEGRGGNDVIDGDAYLDVRISVRDAAGAEIRRVDTLGGVRADLLNGVVNPGQLRIVREILTPANGTAIDTAVFTGARAEYTITPGTGSTVTVAHTGGTTLDGTDTVRNVERLRFSDQTVIVTPTGTPTAPAAPTIGTATAGNTQATVNWTAPNNGGSPITGYTVRAFNAAGTQVGGDRAAGATATSLVVTGLTNGTAYTFRVLATNAIGSSALSGASNAVTPTAGATAPAAPTIGTAVAGNAQATVNWTAPNNGGSAITGYTVRAFNAAGTQVGADRAAGATATSLVVTGLTNGTAYTFRVLATNAIGNSALSAASNAVTPVAAGGGTRELILTSVADTHALQTAAGTNFGAANPLSSDSEITTGNAATRATAYVRFTVPTLGAGESITAANLRLNVTNATPNGPAVRTSPNTWLENTLTWNNRPTIAGTTVGNFGNMVVGRVETPVSGVAVGTVSYELFADINDSVGFSSKEDATATNRPQLVLTISGGGATPNPAPTITGRSPGANSFNFAVTGNPSATFSEDVQGVSATTYQVRNATTNALVAGVVTYTAATRVASFNPDANLAADTRYTVTATGGATAIRDTQGAPLVTSSWTFTTGPAPTVTARTPGIGATNVSRTADLSVTFSEPVQGVATTSVVLRNVVTNATVAAVITRDGTTNRWIVNPSATLAANNQHSVTLTGGAAAIRDLANNPLATTSWTFTTGAA